MVNDPWAAPSGAVVPEARGEDSGDLLPERLRLRGWPAVAREHIWWRNLRFAAMVTVGLGAVAWGALQGSWHTSFAGVVMAGMAVRLGLRQVAYGLPRSLAARIRALDHRSSVEEFEALAAVLDEPWRALVLLDAGARRLGDGDASTAEQYAAAVERSGWLVVFPHVEWSCNNLLAFTRALRGQLDEAERYFALARGQAPSDLRPYLSGTDVIVWLRRGDPIAARRAIAAREEEMAAHPLADGSHADVVDDVRAFLTAAILSAEGAPAQRIDRELSRIRSRDSFVRWADGWPEARPLTDALRRA